MTRSDARQVAVVVDSYSAEFQKEYGDRTYPKLRSGVVYNAPTELEGVVTAAPGVGSPPVPGGFALARAVDGAVGTGTEPLVFHAGRYTGLAG